MAVQHQHEVHASLLKMSWAAAQHSTPHVHEQGGQLRFMCVFNNTFFFVFHLALAAGNEVPIQWPARATAGM